MPAYRPEPHDPQDSATEPNEGYPPWKITYQGVPVPPSVARVTYPESPGVSDTWRDGVDAVVSQLGLKGATSTMIVPPHTFRPVGWATEQPPIVPTPTFAEQPDEDAPEAMLPHVLKITRGTKSMRAECSCDWSRWARSTKDAYMASNAAHLARAWIDHVAHDESTDVAGDE